MSGSVQKALPDVQQWSRGSLGIPGVVGRDSQMSESGRETLTNVRVWWEDVTDVR